MLPLCTIQPVFFAGTGVADNDDAAPFDGISRHSPEGVNFKHRSEVVGWKQAIKERDEGTFNWTSNSPFDDIGRENND